METDRFDRLVRVLTAAPSRRGLGRLLAAGITAGLGGIASNESASAAKKTCKPRCKACQRCQRGKCKSAKDGSACPGGKVCDGGRCVARRCGTGGPCRVFVSSVARAGSALDGLGEADDLCQDLANSAGLSGTYLAWLSAGVQSPSNRFTNRGKAGPYQLVPNAAEDGANPPPIVATDFADLTTCDAGSGECLLHPIDRDETGFLRTGANVWTGTLRDGSSNTGNGDPPDNACDNWFGTGRAATGNASLTTDNWTELDTATCGSTLAVYCFEQA